MCVVGVVKIYKLVDPRATEISNLFNKEQTLYQTYIFQQAIKNDNFNSPQTHTYFSYFFNVERK